mgnify:CR=1 FL=1
MTISETVVWFNSIYELNRKDGEAKSDFSCMLFLGELGVADIDVHKFLGITKCDSLATAERLLEAMNTEGYSVRRGEEKPGEYGIVAVCLYRKRKTNN